VFSYPYKLGKLTSILNKERDECVKAPSKHTNFVDCKFGCVYAIPFSCGKYYIGQSGRCLNCRLTEHDRNIAAEEDGISTARDHASVCNCKILFEQTSSTTYIGQRYGREVIEAFCINQSKDLVVSEPSIKLTEDEANFVRFECTAHLARLNLKVDCDPK
jgi:hypothetical protein